MQKRLIPRTTKKNEHLFVARTTIEQSKAGKAGGDGEMMVVRWGKGRANKRGPDCNRLAKAAAAVAAAAIAAALNSTDEG